MDENEIFEALGVEPEAGDQGGNEQDDSAPAAQDGLRIYGITSFRFSGPSRS